MQWKKFRFLAKAVIFSQNNALWSLKGTVKLIQLVKIAHSFSVCVKSAPLFHFKLAYVVLHMAVKEFIEIRIQQSRNRSFYQSLLIESFWLTLKFHSFNPSNINVLKWVAREGKLQEQNQKPVVRRRLF